MVQGGEQLLLICFQARRKGHLCNCVKEILFLKQQRKETISSNKVAKIYFLEIIIAIPLLVITITTRISTISLSACEFSIILIIVSYQKISSTSHATKDTRC